MGLGRGPNHEEMGDTPSRLVASPKELAAPTSCIRPDWGCPKSDGTETEFIEVAPQTLTGLGPGAIPEANSGFAWRATSRGPCFASIRALPSDCWTSDSQLGVGFAGSIWEAEGVPHPAVGSDDDASGLSAVASRSYSWSQCTPSRAAFPLSAHTCFASELPQRQRTPLAERSPSRAQSSPRFEELPPAAERRRCTSKLRLQSPPPKTPQPHAYGVDEPFEEPPMAPRCHTASRSTSWPWQPLYRRPLSPRTGDRVPPLRTYPSRSSDGSQPLSPLGTGQLLPPPSPLLSSRGPGLLPRPMPLPLGDEAQQALGQEPTSPKPSTPQGNNMPSTTPRSEGRCLASPRTPLGTTASWPSAYADPVPRVLPPVLLGFAAPVKAQRSMPRLRLDRVPADPRLMEGPVYEVRDVCRSAFEASETTDDFDDDTEPDELDPISKHGLLDSADNIEGDLEAGGGVATPDSEGTFDPSSLWAYLPSPFVSPLLPQKPW